MRIRLTWRNGRMRRGAGFSENAGADRQLSRSATELVALTIRRLRQGGGAAHDSGGVEVFGESEPKTQPPLCATAAQKSQTARMSDFNVYVN